MFSLAERSVTRSCLPVFFFFFKIPRSWANFPSAHVHIDYAIRNLMKTKVAEAVRHAGINTYRKLRDVFIGTRLYNGKKSALCPLSCATLKALRGWKIRKALTDRPAFHAPISSELSLLAFASVLTEFPHKRSRKCQAELFLSQWNNQVLENV